MPGFALKKYHWRKIYLLVGCFFWAWRFCRNSSFQRK
jgi:hypothetical protein